MLEQQFTCMKSSWDVQCTLDTRWMVGWLPKRAPQKVIIFFVTKNFGMPKDSSNSKYLYGGLFTFVVHIHYLIFFQFTCRYLFAVAITYVSAEENYTHGGVQKRLHISIVVLLWLYIVNVNSLEYCSGVLYTYRQTQ